MSHETRVVVGGFVGWTDDEEEDDEASADPPNKHFTRPEVHTEFNLILPRYIREVTKRRRRGDIIPVEKVFVFHRWQHCPPTPPALSLSLMLMIYETWAVLNLRTALLLLPFSSWSQLKGSATDQIRNFFFSWCCSFFAIEKAIKVSGNSFAIPFKFNNLQK